jgi:hypothetical protein
MPSITALQIATASLAVPKSVMNTIVCRAAPGLSEARGSDSGGFAHPASNAQTIKKAAKTLFLFIVFELPPPVL